MLTHGMGSTPPPQFMFILGSNTVGACVLLVIAIMGLVGMEVVGKDHAGYSHEGLATQRDMPEHFQCARLEHF